VHLRAVEQWVLLCSAALLLGSLVFGEPRWQLGALVGALLSLGNARSLRFLASRLTPRKSVGLLIVLFQAKLGLIAAIIYVTMRLLPLSPLALLLGLSALPLGILLRGLQYGLRPAEPATQHPSDTGADPVAAENPSTPSHRES
jgi:hypothetical protein